jgi:hypothetical protein
MTLFGYTAVRMLNAHLVLFVLLWVRVMVKDNSDMSILPDERIIEITQKVAEANDVAYLDVTTAPVIDSAGAEAIEITIALTPGSSAAMGERPAQAVSALIRELADAGENRFPIVRFEGKLASPSS